VTATGISKRAGIQALFCRTGVERMVIDFHSHVLPKLDDGSRSVEMSLEMLRLARGMGVDIVLATSHYYGHRESKERFLERRAASWRALSEAMSQESGLPKVLLGAEVAFSSHIVKHPELDELCIEGTRTLLLEMPFSSWTEYELDGVAALSLDHGYQVVLAHFERFLGMPGNEKMLERMMELPIRLQMNGERLLGFGGGKWCRWFEDGRAGLLGSDCHNLTDRPPNLGPARARLARKAGAETLARVDALGAELLKDALSEVT